jgi:hypothetical protein
MGRVAKVTGNIQTPALVIENGALFEGSCRMVPLKEESETTPAADASSSSPAASSNSGASKSGSSRSSYSSSAAAADASAASASDVTNATDVAS